MKFWFGWINVEIKRQIEREDQLILIFFPRLRKQPYLKYGQIYRLLKVEERSVCVSNLNINKHTEHRLSMLPITLKKCLKSKCETKHRHGVIHVQAQATTLEEGLKQQDVYQVRLGQRKQVCLQWIPSDVSVPGNKASDELDGRGCALSNPSSIVLTHSEIHSFQRNKMNLNGETFLLTSGTQLRVLTFLYSAGVSGLSRRPWRALEAITCVI
ncbi:nup43 [Trichonephila clavipes]|nr:nup43 [Trichonephila clavipes]